MIASLPMYATPQTALANARFWGRIRDALRDSGVAAPGQLTLTPGDLMPHWRDPRLVLSQTCGLPLRAALWDDVTLIGTPDYGLSDNPAGYYHSVIIARADDTRTQLLTYAKARFAFNEPMSQSGWGAVAVEAPHILNGPLTRTGSHRASMMAVRAGLADFAAIDAVTWRLFTAAGEGMDCQVVHRTKPTPGLPFITAKTQDAALIFNAIKHAIGGMSDDDRSILGLRDIIAIPRAAYDLPPPPKPEYFLG